MAEVKTLPPPPPVRRFDELGRPTKAQIEYDLRLNEYIQKGGNDPALAAKVNQIESQVGDNLARLIREETARADGDTIIANTVTTVQAATANNTALITTEQTARIQGDDVLGKRIDHLVITSNNGAAVAIDAEVQARINADLALGVRIDAVSADAFQNSADIKREETARITEDAALAQQITTLQATVNNDITAKLTAEQTARANADTALAQQILTVETNVNNNLTAKITQTQQAITDINGNLSTKWAIEGNINGATGKLEFTGVKKADGTGASFGLFIGANTTIAGNLIVDGSISASKLSANQLSAINADLGTVTAGMMRSPDGKFIIDLNNKAITISD